MNQYDRDPAASPRTQLRPNGWGWTLAYGALLGALGVLALLHPIAAGLATGVVFGAVVLVYGCAAVVAGVYAEQTAPRVADLLLGALAILVGLAALFDPVLGALSLVSIAGAWLLATGVVEVLLAGRRTHRALRLLLGIADVVLGAVRLLIGPASAFAFLAAAVAISFLMRGTVLAIAALAMRDAQI